MESSLHYFRQTCLNTFLISPINLRAIFPTHLIILDLSTRPMKITVTISCKNSTNLRSRVSCVTYPRRSQMNKSVLVRATDRYLLNHHHWDKHKLFSFVCWNEKCQEQITVQSLWQHEVQSGTGCFRKKYAMRSFINSHNINAILQLHNTLSWFILINSFVELSYLTEACVCGYMFRHTCHLLLSI